MADNKHIIYAIGHRTTDPFRLRNLMLTLSWLRQEQKYLEHEYHIKLTVVVVEQDYKPSLNLLLQHNHVRYMFVYNCGQYNRGWAFNVAFANIAAETNADYIFCADNDIIMPLRMDYVFRHCFQYSVVSPYSAVFDTRSAAFESADYTDDFPDHFSLSKLMRQNYIKGERPHTCLTGGIVGMSCEIFKTLSGWDEKFRGRGWEDYAFTAKIRLFVPSHEIHVFDLYAIHLWHPWENAVDLGHNSKLNDEYIGYTLDNYRTQISESYYNIGCKFKYIGEPYTPRFLSDEPESTFVPSERNGHVCVCDCCCPQCKQQLPPSPPNPLNIKYAKHKYNAVRSIVSQKHEAQDISLYMFFTLSEQHTCRLNSDKPCRVGCKQTISGEGRVC